MELTARRHRLGSRCLRGPCAEMLRKEKARNGDGAGSSGQVEAMARLTDLFLTVNYCVTRAEWSH